MTPQQLVNHLEKYEITQQEFARRLGVTPALISFWLRSGWISYERQCQIQLELRDKLRASWDDVPAEKRAKVA